MVQEIDRLFQFNELKLRGGKIPFYQKPHITKDRIMKAIDKVRYITKESKEIRWQRTFSA